MQFKLSTDLEGRFIRLISTDGQSERLQIVDEIQDAQGVWFLCPKCYEKNGQSNEGTHMVLLWFRNRGVPIAAPPGPGRWEARGNTLDALSLDPSISLEGGCGWHGYIREGHSETL